MKTIHSPKGVTLKPLNNVQLEHDRVLCLKTLLNKISKSCWKGAQIVKLAFFCQIHKYNYRMECYSIRICLPFMDKDHVQATLHSLKIMEPRPIVFMEWGDTRTFSNLKSTHYTLIILLIINLVTKKSLCIVSKVQSIKLFAPCGTLKVQREQ